MAFRGAGLMLSPLDAELVEAWSRLDVPFEVVARGIRRAAEAALYDARADERPLRSLRACRKHVELEIQKYFRRSAGRAEGEPEREMPHLFRHKKLLAALKRLGREQPELLRGIQRLLDGALARPPDDVAGSSRQEERAYAGLLRALPFERRLSLLREARQMEENVASVSSQARKMGRRFHRAAVLRRELKLKAFW